MQLRTVGRLVGNEEEKTNQEAIVVSSSYTSIWLE
jgi:hypothetical protein